MAIIKGLEWSDQGQRYRCVGIRPHTRADGAKTELADIQSNCATCGQPFVFSVPAGAAKVAVSRRCATHKRPGCRVRRRAA